MRRSVPEIVVDLDREQDIEELRRIAHAQQAQIWLLLEAIAKQNKELASLKGKKGDAQLTLKMLEALQDRGRFPRGGARRGRLCRHAPCDRARERADPRECAFRVGMIQSQPGSSAQRRLCGEFGAAQRYLKPDRGSV